MINSQSIYKTFAWGLTESACNFSLIYILPVLLAIKFRSAKEIAMGGTIIAIVTTASYIISSTAFSISYGLSPLNSDPHPASLAEHNNIMRLYRIGLVVAANIFFIEWAFDDYQAIRTQNKKVTWCQLLARVCCCLQSQKDKQEDSSIDADDAAFQEEGIVDPHYEKQVIISRGIKHLVFDQDAFY